jgi:hypothetical protein
MSKENSNHNNPLIAASFQANNIKDEVSKIHDTVKHNIDSHRDEIMPEYEQEKEKNRIKYEQEKEKNRIKYEQEKEIYEKEMKQHKNRDLYNKYLLFILNQIFSIFISLPIFIESKFFFGCLAWIILSIGIGFLEFILYMVVDKSALQQTLTISSILSILIIINFRIELVKQIHHMNWYEQVSIVSIIGLITLSITTALFCVILIFVCAMIFDFRFAEKWLWGGDEPKEPVLQSTYLKSTTLKSPPVNTIAISLEKSEEIQKQYGELIQSARQLVSKINKHEIIVDCAKMSLNYREFLLVLNIKFSESILQIETSTNLWFFLPYQIVSFEFKSAITSLYSYSEIDISYDTIKCSVPENSNDIPSDAKIIGKTWRYLTSKGNKDGRRKNNYEIIEYERFECYIMLPNSECTSTFDVFDDVKILKFQERLSSISICTLPN